MSKNVFGLLLILFLVCAGNMIYKSLHHEKKEELVRTKISYKKISNATFQHAYQEKYVPHFGPDQPVVFCGNDNITKFILALRWLPIVQAAEARYCPRLDGMTFGLLVTESSGYEFVGNSQNDNGQGVCQMQASMASTYGLHTFNNCVKERCKLDAIALRSFVADNIRDRGLLARTDERFDHVKNIDAAVRMLAYGVTQQQNSANPVEESVKDYGPQGNREQYWWSVKRYTEMLHDQSFMQKVEETFNRINPHLTIDGKPGNWQTYLEAYRKVADNYGLSEYLVLPKYVVN